MIWPRMNLLWQEVWGIGRGCCASSGLDQVLEILPILDKLAPRHRLGGEAMDPEMYTTLWNPTL